MVRNREDVTKRAPSLDRDERTAYRVETNDLEPSTAVVTAVEEVTDDDLLDGGVVLYDVVDPDALDQLFDGRNDGVGDPVGKIVFQLRGCRIEVRSDGELVVYEPTEEYGKSTTPATRPA